MPNISTNHAITYTNFSLHSIRFNDSGPNHPPKGLLRYHPAGQEPIPRVKNHNFSKFAIFKWLNRANQELSFKKIPGKNVFFCADLWSAKVFSMLIILIDRWQVLSYLIRMPLLNQANHAIWQKSWSTSIVLTVFPWKRMPPKEKKKLLCFRTRLQDERRRQNRFAKSGLRN